jgi:uncharacterized membrane protein (GlpM family)
MPPIRSAATLMRPLTLAIVAAGIVHALTVMLANADIDNIDAGLVMFVVWALLPYVVLGIYAFFIRLRLRQGIALVGSVLLLVPALLLYRQSVIESDAQGALVFVVLPLYQSLAALLVIGVAWLAGRLRRSG